MVTISREAPLIFLTTSTCHLPTGRNVRAHLRAQSARQSNPSSCRGGSFGYFPLDLIHASQDDVAEDRAVKRLKTLHDRDQVPDKTALTRFNSSGPSLRILANHFHYEGAGFAPNVNFEDVLKVAAFHIRRRAAATVYITPERTLDALRCRQWCAISPKIAKLGRSPYLDRAIACVVSKVRLVISGNTSTQTMLSAYTQALQALRAAVAEPDQHDRLDMLAATQLLAVYEMLDDSAPWEQHVRGASAMASLLSCRGDTNRAFSAQAAPIFVESLVNDDGTFFESPLWRDLLQAITWSQGPGRVDLTDETVSCFNELRAVFARSQSIPRRESDLSWPTRLRLLRKAHELRSRMKALVIRGDGVQSRGSRFCDVLGLLLVSVMMLDRLILLLRQSNAHRGKDLEEDTQGLCAQMVLIELKRLEKHPGKDLLLALQRQVHYPLLMDNA